MVSRVLICTGKYANEPYHLEKVCVNVYCVEELCYLFANNPFMINTEIMDKHLPEWLREQCGLPELADRLTLAMKKGIQAGEFVDIIIDYVNYCTEAEIARMDEILKSNAGLNDFERKKKQADYLLQNNRHLMALREYEDLNRVLPDTENALRPAIYHNMGYAYAGIFTLRRSIISVPMKCQRTRSQGCSTFLPYAVICQRKNTSVLLRSIRNTMSFRWSLKRRLQRQRGSSRPRVKTGCCRH